MCPYLSFLASKCPQVYHSPPSRSYLLHSTVDQRAVASLGGPVHHDAFSELRFFILTHVVRAVQRVEDSWAGDREVMSGPGSTPGLPSYLELSVGRDDFSVPEDEPGGMGQAQQPYLQTADPGAWGRTPSSDT